MFIAYCSFFVLYAYRKKAEVRGRFNLYCSFARIVFVASVASNLLMLAEFLSLRQGLRLDPPGGDGVYYFSFISFGLISFFTVTWAKLSERFVLWFMLLVLLMICVISIECYVSQAIPVIDYLAPVVLGIFYAFMIKIYVLGGSLQMPRF